MLKTLWLGCATYVAITVIFFGGLLQPIFLATVWSDRLAAPYWGWIVFACFAIGTASFFLSSQLASFRGPVFVSIGLLGSLFSVGAYADHFTWKALQDFGADRRIRHSLINSVRHAPDEFQIFLHAAALKRCVPFAWSYRSLSFYQIPPDAAINVLPQSWLAACPSIRAASSRQ
jgi:hypothetical protein